jgi:hypothetical protein
MALGSTQPLTEMSTRNLPGGKCDRSVGLRTLLPSVSRSFRENVGASTSHNHNPMDLHGLYRDSLTFTFTLTFTLLIDAINNY